jgi:hypothetical protein
MRLYCFRNCIIELWYPFLNSYVSDDNISSFSNINSSFTSIIDHALLLLRTHMFLYHRINASSLGLFNQNIRSHSCFGKEVLSADHLDLSGLFA